MKLGTQWKIKRKISRTDYGKVVSGSIIEGAEQKLVTLDSSVNIAREILATTWAGCEKKVDHPMDVDQGPV